MIRYDSAKETAFGPFDLNLEEHPTKCLMVFDDEIWEELILQNETETFQVRNAQGRVFDSYRYVENNGEKILVMSPTTGAAGSVCDMEILIGSGIDKIVAFGTCGWMDESLARNMIIVPAAAYREEGTSCHYLPDSDAIDMDARAVDLMKEKISAAGLQYREGKIWTTDAVYRETFGKIQYMKERGCLGVEMELSALLAVAEYRNIKFAEFLICEDAVGVRNPGSIERDNNAIFCAAIDILSEL